MDELLELLEEIRPDIDFENTDFLVDGNVLDSFDVISIVEEINSRFGISLDVADIVPENFNSLEAMEKLIKKYT